MIFSTFARPQPPYCRVDDFPVVGWPWQPVSEVSSDLLKVVGTVQHPSIQNNSPLLNPFLKFRIRWGYFPFSDSRQVYSQWRIMRPGRTKYVRVLQVLTTFSRHQQPSSFAVCNSSTTIQSSLGVDTAHVSNHLKRTGTVSRYKTPSNKRNK